MGGLGQAGLCGGCGEEAGDEQIGELAEARVDLLLQGGEGGGIASEQLGPALLLFAELGVDVLDRLLGERDGTSRLGAETEEHGATLDWT